MYLLLLAAGKLPHNDWSSYLQRALTSAKSSDCPSPVYTSSVQIGILQQDPCSASHNVSASFADETLQLYMRPAAAESACSH